MYQYKLISEILEEVGTLPKLEDQITMLKKNESLPLRQLLKAALDPSIEFDVVIPAYKPSVDAPGCSANNLYIESRRLYVFLKGSKVSSQKRRSTLIAQILESIDSADAELLVQILHKDITMYGVDVSVVKIAFPGLLP
jgi:hypothetical protein